MCRNILLLLGTQAACVVTSDPATATDTDAPASLSLRWIQGWSGETWEVARAGLHWSLSALGANGGEQAITVVSQDADVVWFELDPEAAGLSAAQRAPLDDAWEELSATAELDTFGGVDLGRFLMRSLYEPWRYYEATGACLTLEGWRTQHPRADVADVAITDSLLTEGDRLVTYDPAAGELPQVAWVAGEGEGSLVDGTLVVRETEVVDLMVSGRQRYAVYDEDGRLVPAPTVSPAGQPGRCMWCHEDHLMQTIEQPDVDGHGTFADFDAAVVAQQALLDAYRAQLDTPVDFADARAVHAYSERLVESFLFPTVERVAREWEVEPAEVEALGLPTHENDEYGETVEVLTRADVDDAWEDGGGFVVVRTLASARELDPDASLAGEDAARLRLEPCL